MMRDACDCPERESAGLLYPMHALFALLFAAQPFARCPDCGRQYDNCYCGFTRT